MNNLLEIATLVQGTLIGISRSVAEKMTIVDAMPLDQAAPGTLTMLDNARNAHRLTDCSASASIVATGDVETILQTCKAKSLILVAVDEAHVAFEKAVQLIRPKAILPKTGIDARAVVAENVQFGRDVSIGALAVIGANCVIGDRTVIHPGVKLLPNCRIGRDCEIFPNAVLYQGTILDERVIVHAGVIVGGYGFGYRQNEGRHVRTAQLGWVHIEADSEIGANTTIDRGTYGVTQIGTGTKIDNLVQVAHNVQVGPHNLICSQVGIAGSAKLGSHVVLAGQVGVRDHLTVGDRVRVGAQSGLVSDLDADMTVVGSPAMPLKESLQCLLASQRLPEMRKQLRQMQQTLNALQAQADSQKSASDLIPHKKAA